MKSYYPQAELKNHPEGIITPGVDFENNGGWVETPGMRDDIYNTIIGKRSDAFLSTITKTLTSGWMYEGYFPDNIKKSVIAFVPHRRGKIEFSNGLAMHRLLNFPNPRAIAKKELKRLSKILPFTCIDRKKSNGVVKSTAQSIIDTTSMSLIISPEGTRSENEVHWRPGFYHIANTAGVPILFLVFDYENKKLILSEPFHPTGDIYVDLPKIQRYFKKKLPNYEIWLKGKKPLTV